MKGLCKSALAALVLAACGGDGAITEPTTPNASPSGGGILAIGVDSLTGASIETNKDDYSPGEIVHVVGKGWAPGETVNLHMTEEPDTHADVDTNVVADSTGAFSIHYYDVQPHDLGVTFTLTATGASSHSVAVATFTDGALADAQITIMNSATPCVTPNTTFAAGVEVCASVLVDVTGGGANPDLKVEWVDPSNVVAFTQSFTGVADNTTHQSKYTPTVGGSWKVRSCKSSGDCASAEGIKLDEETFSVASASAPTTTTVASSQNPSVTNQSVTFTAAVKVTATNAPVTTGTVTFRVGDCSSGAIIGSAQALNASGEATQSRSFAAATDDPSTIRACYSGASGFASSDGSLVQEVDKANVTVVVSDPASTSVGDNVTFNVTVTPAHLGAATPTGAVNLYEFSGSESCSSPPVVPLATDASAPYSLTTSFSTAGTHVVTACYVGDGNFNANSGTDTHSVSLLTTTTELSSSADPSVTGQPVTFTATVKHNGSAIGANGSVSFRVGGTGCSDATQFANVSLNASGQATTPSQTYSASGGDKTIWACYSGTPTTYAESNTSMIQDVDKATTTLSLGTSGSPSFFGNAVTFTATIGVQSPGTGSPSGTVNFYDGGVCNANGSGTGTLIASDAIASGSAAITTSSLNVATHTIQACYGGDGDFTNANDDVEQVVNKAVTLLTLSSNNNPSQFGESVTFTATITFVNGAGTLSGNVNFAVGGTCNANGSISAPTQSLGNDAVSGNTATVSISTLNASATAYNIVACFGETANILGDGDQLSQTVERAQTEVLLVDTPASTAFGAQVNFKATVTVKPNLGGGTPTGTVAFRIGSTSCSDGNVLGTDVSGVAGVYEIDVTSALLDVAGSAHTIRACFDNTDGNYTDSEDTEPHVITAATTGTTIAVAPTSQQYSDKVVFTATVTPASVLGSTQTGNVQFQVGGTNTGAAQAITCGATQCTATLTYTIGAQASPPTLAISAAFTSTNVNFGNSTSSTDAILTVTKEEATVLNEAVSPSNILVGQGGTLTFSVKETSPESNAGTLAAAGDLTKIAVADVLVTGKGILDPSKTISFSCSRTIGGTALDYTHVLNYTCTFGAVNAADTYEVDIDVTGNYYDGVGATVIQVTDPNAGFTTGGGWYWYDQTNYPGEKVNFGFMAKATTNNKKTVFQGSLLVIRHKTDGSVVKIKSNVFEGYSIGSTSGDCTPATFTGKATYAVNGVSEGNFAFTGYGLDCGEPGTADKFSLYHAKSPNAVSTAASVGALSTSSKTIVGGNVQVPQPSRR
jgi:hypothetical protein